MTPMMASTVDAIDVACSNKVRDQTRPTLDMVMPLDSSERKSESPNCGVRPNLWRGWPPELARFVALVSPGPRVARASSEASAA